MHRRRPEQGPLLAVLYELNLLRSLEEMMWQAGLYMRLADILLIMVLLFGAGLFGGNILFHGMWFALGSGLVMACLPLGYIQFRRKRRLAAFGNQLPFALDLIKSSLEAGHSLQRALQVLVGEFADPLGAEFRTVLSRTGSGCRCRARSKTCSSEFQRTISGSWSSRCGCSRRSARAWLRLSDGCPKSCESASACACRSKR